MSDLEVYLKHRPQMGTGDLLLWKSLTSLGWMIRKITKAKVNHAGLVIRFPTYNRDRLFTIEALSSGIEMHPLSARLMRHKGMVWWYPMKPEFESLRVAMGDIALSVVNEVDYDYPDLFAQLVKRVDVDEELLFCSEFCHWDWEAAGIPYSSNLAPRPGDLLEYNAPIDVDRETLIYSKGDDDD